MIFFPSKVPHLRLCCVFSRLSRQPTGSPCIVSPKKEKNKVPTRQRRLTGLKERAEESGIKTKGFSVLNRKSSNRFLTAACLWWTDPDYFHQLAAHPKLWAQKTPPQLFWASGVDRRAPRCASVWTRRHCLISLCYNYPAVEMMRWLRG